MATKKKEQEEQPAPSTPPPTPPESPPERSVPAPGGENTLQWLAEQYEQQRPSYDGQASIYRWSEGGRWKDQAWAAEIACGRLLEAEKFIASVPNGGPGLYTVYLLTSRGRQKVKGLYATFRVEADLRAHGAAGQAGAEPLSGQAQLITALAVALKPERDPLVTVLLTKALDGNADALTKERAAFEMGVNVGMERGRILAGDQWKPRDVVDLVREVKDLFKNGGSGSGSSVFDVFKTALGVGATAGQTIAFLELFRGKALLLGLKAKLPELISSAKQDPDTLKLLQQPGAEEWLVDFAGKIDAMKEDAA